MVPASSFVPREASHWRFASQGRALRRENNLPTVCSSHFSAPCFHAVCPHVVCLSSLQEKHSAHQVLSQTSLLTFTIHDFKHPLLARTQEIQALLFSKPVTLEKRSPFVFPVHSSVYLPTPFSMTMAPSPLQQLQSISPLIHIFILPAFSDVV